MTTIGVDFRFKTMRLHDESIKLQIWDTAGQERYKTLTSAYYRNADGVVVVFDLTERATFLHVKDWLGEVAKHSQMEEQVRLVIGNKSDETRRRKVTKEEVRKLSRETGITVVEASAKLGTRIEDAFRILTENIISNRTNRSRSEYNGVRLEAKALHTCDTCCCCVHGV
eukprot:TRINITY_DN2984_c0_g2_i2.p2 TRINITY_DN2984_c0_g2~~TRINITY_DN2984_c0_g2_i2.p2  ORF type:complete len:169 (-),score=36.24 TRINITY_DN2984_c0_g2_i2:147-653(-)